MDATRPLWALVHGGFASTPSGVLVTGRFTLARLSGLALVVAATAAAFVCLTAGPAAASETPLTVSNAVTTNQIDTPVALTISGGLGSGPVLFAVTGKGC